MAAVVELPAAPDAAGVVQPQADARSRSASAASPFADMTENAAVTTALAVKYDAVAKRHEIADASHQQDGAVESQIDAVATPKKTRNVVCQNIDRDLQEPSKPKAAFFCFLDSARPAIAEELSSRNVAQVAKAASERWKSMSADAKAPFEAQAADLKRQYDVALAAFLEQGGTPKKRLRKGDDQKPEVAEGPPQPLRPKSAFFCFLNSARAAIAEEVGSSKGSVVCKIGGQRWKEMSDEARAPFEGQAVELRRTYQKDMEAFVAEGGVLRKRKSKAEPEDAVEDQDPSAQAQAERQLPEDMQTPKKRRRPAERARVQFSARIMAVSGHGLVQGEERLRLKRDRRGQNTQNSIAVFDGSLGGHVGYLDADIAEKLSPLLDQHNTLLVMGRVASQSEGKEDSSDTGTTVELKADVTISGPLELAAELESWKESLTQSNVSDAPVSVGDKEEARGDSCSLTQTSVTIEPVAEQQ